MTKKKTNKSFYDEDTVLSEVVNYFFNNDKAVIINMPFQKVYDDIVQHTQVNMPKFSQIRRMIIAFLKDRNLWTDGERLTSETAYRICGEFYGDLEFWLKEYSGELIQENVIPYILPLPPIEIIRSLSSGIAKETSVNYTERILINSICRNIKNQNSDIVVAVIPESNPIPDTKISNKKVKIRTSSEEKEFSALNICNAICIYVKDNEEGRRFIDSISKKNN